MDIPIIVSATELVRKFGYYAELLSSVDGLIIVRDGKVLGTLTPAWEAKRERFLKSAGSLKDTGFSDERIWKEVFKRKSRSRSINL